MTAQHSPWLESAFRKIIALRWWIVAFYALLLGPSIYFALKVPQDNSLERLMVQTDPDYIASRAFAEVFGGGEYSLLLAEADDPFAPGFLAAVDKLEQALQAVPGVSPQSIVGVYRRAHPGLVIDAAQAQEIRKFALGTSLFTRQGLVTPKALSVPVVTSPKSAADRTRLLGEVDRLVDEAQKAGGLGAVRRVGQPYAQIYLDTQTSKAAFIYFPLFAVFVIILNILLYRSFRALFSFIITLAVSAVTTVGYIGATGGQFTIVSALVPMTVLITCTATLVYVHSRYVDQPPGVSVEDHQIFALANKFLACTASVFATAVGFAALAVSKIRPIREMGIWVAVGLLMTWVMVFTLFPALQRIFHTPTTQERRVAGTWFLKLVEKLPLFSYRHRWLLVPGALLLCAAGVVALFGFPGALKPMKMETNAIEYINHSSQLYRDTKRIEREVAGLSITEIWLKSDKLGRVTDPEVVRGLDRFHRSIEQDARVSTVASPTMVLRMMRYLAGQGDQIPEDAGELEKLTDTIETLLAREPMLQSFIEKNQLAQTHLSVVTKAFDYEGLVDLEKMIKTKWAEAGAQDPALKDFELRIVGISPLQAKISFHLVPTLVESFGLTVGIIFVAFLVVFRSGAARLMALIPSLFAILVMFLFMRLVGMELNIATILIASTVLGTSENDQIHFFYHYQEGEGTTEAKLRHTVLIAGRAIFFATLINAGGFLAFAVADLPPIRQFGMLASIAFVLSMIADFTALPAALWLIFRDKPESLKGKKTGAEMGAAEPAKPE